MGNKVVKKTKSHPKDDANRRGGLFAMVLQKRTNEVSSDAIVDPIKKDEDKQKSSLFDYKATKARRMAVFGQTKTDKQTPEAVANPVLLDVVFRVPRSKIIVNPYDFDSDSDHKIIEKSVNALDSELPFKNILYELFPSRKVKRHSWKSARKLDGTLSKHDSW